MVIFLQTRSSDLFLQVKVSIYIVYIYFLKKYKKQTFFFVYIYIYIYIFNQVLCLLCCQMLVKITIQYNFLFIYNKLIILSFFLVCQAYSTM